MCNDYEVYYEVFITELRMDTIINKITLMFSGYLPIYVALACVLGLLLTNKYLHNRNRYQPISNVLKRRTAGYGVASQIDSFGIDLGLLLGGTVMLPLFPFAFQNISKSNDATFYMMLIICIAIDVFLVWKMHILARRRWRYLLGFDCEVCVGIELDQLMKQGYDVFHDVQMGNFNIDHLVIGPNGVFAVETKGRRKNIQKNANGSKEKQYKVVFENGQLHFPNWKEIKPIEQTTRQAKSVESWLNQSLGYEIGVMPVLVFPGWYVESKSKPLFPILNQKQLIRTIPKLSSGLLTQVEIQQIANQVEQRNLYFGSLEKEKNRSFADAQSPKVY